MASASSSVRRIDERRVITLTCLGSSAAALKDAERYINGKLAEEVGVAGVSVRTPRSPL